MCLYLAGLAVESIPLWQIMRFHLHRAQHPRLKSPEDENVSVSRRALKK